MSHRSENGNSNPMNQFKHLTNLLDKISKIKYTKNDKRSPSPNVQKAQEDFTRRIKDKLSSTNINIRYKNNDLNYNEKNKIIDNKDNQKANMISPSTRFNKPSIALKS